MMVLSISAYVVIMHLKDKMPQGDFLRVMDSNVIAHDLLLQVRCKLSFYVK